jgi:hypothetical protein
MLGRDVASGTPTGRAAARWTTHVGRILLELGQRDQAWAVALACESELVTPGR